MKNDDWLYLGAAAGILYVFTLSNLKNADGTPAKGYGGQGMVPWSNVLDPTGSLSALQWLATYAPSSSKLLWEGYQAAATPLSTAINTPGGVLGKDSATDLSVYTTAIQTAVNTPGGIFGAQSATDPNTYIQTFSTGINTPGGILGANSLTDPNTYINAV